MWTSWEQASPRKGLTYHAHAVDFALNFPLEVNEDISHFHPSTPRKIISQRVFAEWAARRGLLVIPPESDKGTYTWKGYVDARNRVRRCLNKAANHPRMKYEAGINPYSIDSLRYGVLEIRLVEHAVQEDPGPVQITHTVYSARARRQQWLQGISRECVTEADWVMLNVLFNNCCENDITIVNSAGRQMGSIEALKSHAKKLGLPSPPE